MLQFPLMSHSDFFWSWMMIPVIGFIVTLYALSIGRGGGLLYVGVLTSLIGVQPQMAISTSLAILAPTTIVGAWSHWKQGNVSFRFGKILLFSGCAGAFLGSLGNHWIPPFIFKKVVGLIFLITVLKFIYDKNQTRKKESISKLETSSKISGEMSPDRVSQVSFWKASSYGVLGGCLSGISGMSGSAAITAALLPMDICPLQMVGTSLFAISGISLVGFLMHLEMGLVNWSLVSRLGVGSVLGSFISPYLLEKIPAAQLSRYYPVIMILVLSGTTFRLLFG